MRSLLERATQRLGLGRRLFLVIDQFEEFLILKTPEQQQALQRFLSERLIERVTVLLVYRPEYEGVLQDQSWPRLHLDANRRVVSPFTENAAQAFMHESGLNVSQDQPALLEPARAQGLSRPMT